MLFIEPNIQIPDSEFEFTYVRSSGPGGQNVNKVNSKAVLRWPVAASATLPGAVKARFLARYQSRLTVDGEVIVNSQRYRDQGRNVDDCLEKLRAMIAAVAQPPVKRRPTKPTHGSVKRRLQTKRTIKQRKQRRRLPVDEEE